MHGEFKVKSCWPDVCQIKSWPVHVKIASPINDERVICRARRGKQSMAVVFGCINEYLGAARLSIVGTPQTPRQ
jgi:hypothetical protein